MRVTKKQTLNERDRIGDTEELLQLKEDRLKILEKQIQKKKETQQVDDKIKEEGKEEDNEGREKKEGEDGEDGKDEEDDELKSAQSEVEDLRKDLEYMKQAEKDFEAQWVNLATTAVISHYNAAVELEFMSKWKEALVDYEKA